MNDTVSQMYAALKALNPKYIDIQDDGHLHQGHTHANAGHYTVTIMSTCFTGLNRIERHRLIYDKLHDTMPTIHALSISALAPEESSIGL